MTASRTPLSAPAARRRAAFDRFANDPSFRWLLRQRARRCLVVAHASLTAVGVALLMLWAAGPRFWLAERVGTVGAGMAVLVVTVVLFAGWCALTALLNISVHGMTELPNAALDDVQVALRRTAEAQANRVASLVAWVVAVARSRR